MIDSCWKWFEIESQQSMVIFKKHTTNEGTALNSFTGLLEKVWKSCEERCGDVEQIMNAYATAGPSTWVVPELTASVFVFRW